MRQGAQLELNLGASGGVLEAFEKDLSRSTGNEKHKNKLSVFLFFLYFWQAWKRCLRSWGVVLDDVGSRVMFFRSFLDMLATSGRTAGARWRHDGPKMGHESAKMGHDSGKMGILSSTWELLGQFWEQFSRILGDGLESNKH